MRRTEEPLNRQKRLRAWLEEEILEGRMRPGDPIDEQDLARRFGVSRTPVRETLLQLASLDLVAMRPRMGASVRQISLQEIAAMWEVLVDLESLAAGLAARRMDAGDRKALAAIHEASGPLVKRNDAAGYDDANRRFHEAIYAGCRNSYLADLAMTIRGRLRPYRRYPFQRVGGLKRSLEGHAAVLDAILNGDDEAAARAMKQHVAGGLTFLDLAAEMPLAKPEAGKGAASGKPGKARTPKKRAAPR
jgi:DNA-binding GntR family transcriptional regulator